MNWYLLPTIVIFDLLLFCQIHSYLRQVAEEASKNKVILAILFVLVCLAGVGMYQYAMELITSIDYAGRAADNGGDLNLILQELRKK